MIEGSCGIYTLQCDICGADASEEFSDFWDMVQYKKDHGWKNGRRKGKHEWEQVCPECQDEEAGLA